MQGVPQPYNNLFFISRKISCPCDTPNFDQNHVPFLTIKIVSTLNQSVKSLLVFLPKN